MKNRFLPSFFFIIFIGLTLIGTTNFILDGDNLYAKKLMLSQKNDFFNDHSYFALTNIKIDERLLKKGMLLNSQNQRHYDCIIMGSSRAMLISSLYDTAPAGCHDILNLSVSGAGIEDALLMSYYLSTLATELLPAKIYIDLSHWSFRWGEEESWKILKRDYEKAFNFFMHKQSPESPIDFSLMANLLNYDYLVHSMKIFAKQGYKLNAPLYTAISNPFMPDNGPEDTSILKDGSRVYSREQRQSNANPHITGKEEYKISSLKPDPQSLDAYKNIAEHFKKRGVEVIYFAMPYHSSVAKEPAPLAHAITKGQFMLQQLATTPNISVRGSFNIKQTPCEDAEMMDFMHPNAACATKLLQVEDASP